ncbi:FtsX-like permease family protein [Amycolatopsis viridis]|uniref:ABC transport system permease protein n=1 Tax=Amycolatopsis viridis TaxID=185678 RepID=A0ABX0SSW5_9PSEU|nr:ABC transporter permease [Amycolatopsis viridis]NIH80058.1 putative ABC transport system permease protein [Amycolatopsis viridis]
MLRLSWTTFTDRWALFLGAILTVCLGVALVQSSLLVLVSAATAGGEVTEAITLLAMTLGISAFLAVFIVSSTFAFTVAQRRRDLALLRLTGAARGQVRRLLLSEALLLGLLGTAAGVPLGLPVMRLQTWLLHDLGFVPAAFTPRWQDWILAVSAGTGTGVALIGVLAASRRAAKVRPLEALRETGAATRVMTAVRWFFGVLFLAGAVAMATVAAFAPPEGAVPLAINTALASAVALTALSPLVVPLAGRVAGLLLRGPLGRLAQANLRDGVRRSASTAAPLIVLVALLVAQAGTLATIAGGADLERRADIRGDLVVTTTGPSDLDTADTVHTGGVVSPESRVPITVVTRDEDGTETDEALAKVVDPGAYAAIHTRGPASGSLAALTGDTIAVADGSGALGDVVTARIGGSERNLRVVAVMPESLSGGVDFLLPSGVVPAGLLAAAPTESIVRLAPGAGPATVTTRGTVTTVDDWIATTGAAEQQTGTGIMTVLMGLSGLYALLAVINAVVIAAADRRREFAVARVTGLTRGQVVRAAVLESGLVTAIGLVLGGLAASATLAGISSAAARISGQAVLVVPWTLIAVVVLGAFLVVGVTSAVTALSATRPNPVSLTGAA